MEKIIIESEIPLIDALKKCIDVVSEGRISKTSKGKQYCFHTSYADGIEVSVIKNKKSERFIVY